MTAKRTIIAINSGSSSLKFAVYRAADMGAKPPAARGEFSRLGLEGSRFAAWDGASGKFFFNQMPLPHHEAALKKLHEYLDTLNVTGSICGIGHRLVHGGSLYADPQLIEPDLLAAVSGFIPLAPEHLPHELKAVDFCLRDFPQASQVACFDTAFHQRAPRTAVAVPLPRRFEQAGIRRYGFHGISCEYIMMRLKEIAPNEAAGRIVIAHLGNGASMTAVKDGRGMDNTMGFTPSGGLMMSTRSGDLDPGVIFYLLRERKIKPGELYKIINHESGLIGVSAMSSDMEHLLDSQKNSEAAAEAVSLFCYQAKKFLGGLCFAIGGIDSLIFTGGIGEKSAEIRSRICEGLEFTGLSIDREKNKRHSEVISREGSAVNVRVINTDEEFIIARHTLRLLKAAEVV